MKKYDRDEDEIIRLLGRLPEVKDRSRKEEVMSGLSAVRSRRGSRNRKRWMPAVTAAAALLVFSVLAVSLLTQSETFNEAGEQKDSSRDRMVMDQRDDRDAAVIHSEKASSAKGDESEKKEHTEAENAKSQEQGRQSEADEAEPAGGEVQNVREDKAQLSSHYASDASGVSYVTVGVPDEQMNFMVPVTMQSTGKAGSIAGRISEAMAALNEEELGLSEYFPLDAVFSEGPEEQTIKADIPSGSKLLEMDQVFISSLMQTMKYSGIRAVYFYSEGKPGAEFSHYGRLEKQEAEKEGKKAFFLYEGGRPENLFLVPSNNSYESINEALEALKKGPGIEGAAPSVPAELSWDSPEREGDILVLPFLGKSEMEDEAAYSLALEAILLTAKDFGYRAVRFENAPAASIRFDLEKAVDVPSAPNKLE